MPTFPYSHKEAFKVDFEEAWKDGAVYNGQTSRVGFETPYQIYENLKQNTLGMMVMGNFQFTGETTKLQNFGVSSETPAKAMWESLSKATTLEDAEEELRRRTATLSFQSQHDTMTRFLTICRIALSRYRGSSATQARVDTHFKQYAKAQLSHLDQTSSSASSAPEDSEWEKSFRDSTGDSWTSVSGAILWDQNWTAGVNDAWLLGGIHNRFEFHYSDDSMAGGPRGMSSKIGSKGQLWDTDRPEGQRLRVTGRELLGLYNFGYERAKIYGDNQDFQISFHVANEAKWAQATFTRYNGLMKELEADDTRIVAALREAAQALFKY